MSDLSDETLEEIRAAEAAAQRSVCNIPNGKPPKALADALERRVEVNAAQHVAGRPVVRVGGTDEQVRDLEAPWSRRSTPEPTPDSSGRQRRTAKKATNKENS